MNGQTDGWGALLNAAP